MRITLENVTKKFFSLRGTHKAVDALSLEIRDKEFFVLLGPSGCGKSTTLNLIAGLEKPSDGTILFDDTAVASVKRKMFLSPRERNIAMVFQSYALYPHLNVFENIAFPLRIQKMKESNLKTIIETTAQTLNLTPLLKSKPAELSGGERQRVAIARAIVRQPDVFLLDEPLSNLDAQLRASTRATIKQLQRTLGVTTVYVTHDQTEALTLGDRIAVLNNGAIEQIGTPEELYERPRNIFVASFIGSPKINLYPAEVIKGNGNCMVKIGNFSLDIPADKNALFHAALSGKCTVGIRPEHIHIHTEKRSGSVKITVTSVELLGREIILRGQNTDLDIVAVTHHKDIKENQDVYATFDIGKLLFF